MMRETQPVRSEPVERPTDGTRDTHPAFGIAVLHRGTGTTGTALFQSDLRHRETVTLEIKRAERTRSLAHDWTFGRETLIEVEMSLAQWGALVSAQGIGGGVPVTIRATETDRQVPGIPYESRLAESIGEVRGAAAELIKNVDATMTELEEAVASGKIGAIKKAMGNHARVFEQLESNSEFYVKSMQEAAETVVSNARADIEAHILGSQRLVGGASIGAPDAPVLAIDVPREGE